MGHTKKQAAAANKPHKDGKMEWTRSETLALASEKCVYCQGEGIRTNRRGENPCHCVFRTIFRICYRRFQKCVVSERISHARLEITRGTDGRFHWGRKEEEFAADFCLIARRSLDEIEYRVFRFHFLLGADWRLCSRRLNMDRGTFFHHVYRIQSTLGRIFRELQPYGLFPLDEYFEGTIRKIEPLERRSEPVPIRAGAPKRLNVPIKRAA